MPDGLNVKATNVVRCDVENSSIFLKGYIDQAVFLAIQKSVDLICQKNRDGPIYFFINSRGGEVDPAFAICHVLNNCLRTTVTVAQKNAQSAALLPIQIGTHRFSTAKTSFLIHEIGMHYHDTLTANKCLSIFKGLATYNAAMMIVLGRSGQSMDQLNKILENGDFFFSASTAQKMGFVDKVLPRNKKTPKQIREYVTRYLAKQKKETKPESQK